MKNILISVKIKKNKFGKINYILENNWTKYFHKKKINLIPVNYKNQNKKKLDHFNPIGIILSGGNDLKTIYKKKENLIREKNDKFILKYGLKKKIPILAVCYGFQFIAKFYNSKLVKIKNHIRKFHTLEIKKKFPFKKKIIVNSFHNFGFYSLSNIFSNIIKTNDGSIEIARIKKKKILCFMFHPERKNKSQKILNKIVFNHLKI